MEQSFGKPVAAKIKKVINETEFVKTFVLDVSLGAKPGQFVNVWLPYLDEKPFSVAYDDGKETWITFFAVGPMSQALFSLEEGNLIGIRGPYGTSYSWEPKETLALVAGGYGTAPMYFVAREAAKDGAKIHFIVGAKSKEHLLYLDRLKEIKGLTIHISTDDGSMGFKGFNVALLEELIKKEKIDRVFGCGPEKMEYKIMEICLENKISGWLSVERYMKCGFGVCGHCCMDDSGLRVCKEGAVMSTELLSQLPEFGKYHRDKVGRKVMF